MQAGPSLAEREPRYSGLGCDGVRGGDGYKLHLTGPGRGRPAVPQGSVRSIVAAHEYLGRVRFGRGFGHRSDRALRMTSWPSNERFNTSRQPARKPSRFRPETFMSTGSQQ